MTYEFSRKKFPAGIRGGEEGNFPAVLNNLK
jgi:hypothetical protein